MKLSIIANCFIATFLLSLLHSSVFAIPKSYIVYMGSHEEEPRLLVDPYSVTKSHHEILSNVLQSDLEATKRLIYSYNKVFNAFAAILHEKEVKELKKHPDVISVFESRHVNPQTTQSWEFLGIDMHQTHGVHSTSSLWEKTRFGEDLIVAAIDSGVWPESMSFTDKGLGPIPKKFKGHCDNENDKNFRCNRKLVGARYFHKGYAEALKARNVTFNESLSPRDISGHGTHVLSTIGGSFVRGANASGLASGVAKGGVPRARLVSYKSCWSQRSDIGACCDIDTLAAFEAAIHDGVDIINYSIAYTGLLPYFDDVGSIGSFHAMKHGILVVGCAGNAGPRPGILSNKSPWILTVAASTMNREFVNDVVLGNKQQIKGGCLSSDKIARKFYPLVSGSDGRIRANGSLDPLKVKGKIFVLPYNGSPANTKIAVEAYDVGAVGIILANEQILGSNIMPWDEPIPVSHISHSDSKVIFNYINSTTSPIASFTEVTTKIGTKRVPFMAEFSSRGPNYVTEDLLKPDVTAPGVNILAAKKDLYVLLSGTSMASPHVAAIVGLLKTLYPHWSPAALKSAIMTTASPIDNVGQVIREENLKDEATPFAYGAGHVRPNLAIDPGLVYDMDFNDYLKFLCSQFGFNQTSVKKFSKDAYKCPESQEIWDFNYPTMTIKNFIGNVTMSRKLKNVGTPGTYTARVNAPPGVSIVVEPNTMIFSTIGQVIGYKLIVTANVKQLPTDYAFGTLVWSDSKHIVRSPIVIIPKGRIERDLPK